ncbi:MAG: hypothetical protein AB1468_03775 [Candidatus Micrarchaeota archaeon]
MPLAKAQSAIEITGIISVMLVVLALFTVLMFYREASLDFDRRQTEAKSLCGTVASQINMAVIAGEGYVREFYLKETFSWGAAYTVNTSEYYVYVYWGDGESVICSTLAQNATGAIINGRNLIRNSGGVISVS